MITVDVLRCRVVVYAVLLLVYLSNIFRHIYLRRQKFSFPTYTELNSAPETGADFRRRKIKSIYGAGFWSVCHGL